MPADLAGAIVRAGLTDGTPVAVAAVGPDGVVAQTCSGTWPSDRIVLQSDSFYAASLAKQVTGAAAAVLVHDGRLDPDATVASCVSGLPAWADAVTVAQLAHHTAGLPETARLPAGDWTTDGVLDMLRQLHVPPHIPGAAYVYSNAGYILLAHIVGLRSGVEFPRFVQERLFRPHGLAEMQYLADAETFPAQGSLMGPRLPLSVGDGGLWCTADNFARWLHLMNVDVFGTADFVATAGRLSDGTPVDYGWGIGLRQRAGKQLFLHGGSWRGARARTVRMPDPGIGLVAFAATEGGDALTALVDDLVDEMLEALQ